MKLAAPPEYEVFLAPYPQATRLLALQLREALVEVLPPCIETLWDATNAVGMAYGFTEHNRDHFLHLPVYTQYVNLGFSQGASLADPESRLKGKGARIRHLRLTEMSNFFDVYVQDLIRQSWELAGPPIEPVLARTIVRVMEGPKRRPRP